MTRPTALQLQHGRDEPTDIATTLVAGPVTALFEAGDLRNVRAGDVELIQRIYVAVRDDVWNTIPATLSDVAVRDEDDGFEVTFTARHAHADIDLTWTGRITGDADGTIRYEFNGTAGSDFRYAKIGFNVHHALAESVGRRYRATTPGGVVEGTLPAVIDPQRLVEGRLTAIFPEYDRLTIWPRDDLRIEFTFEGDLFEMQDHRNWTDANYKSYGTPLSVPWPMDAHPGQTFHQVITVRAIGTPGPAPTAQPRVRVHAEPAGPIPAIGSTLMPEHLPLSERELGLVRALELDHLRVDVYLEDADWQDWLRDAAAACVSVDVAVELAVFVAEGMEAQLGHLAQALRSAAVSVARVLVFAEGRGFAIGRRTTPADLMAATRRELGDVVGGAPFIGGTNQFFAEINREYPDPKSIDGAVYSINPQTHAADDRSVMENLQGQEDTVVTTQHHLPEQTVHVSPITLVGRFGPFPGGPPAEGDLPGNVDVRQVSLLTAAWTVGTLNHLARAGAASITLFEVVGSRGLVERDAGSSDPRFPSVPGMVFPVYDVLAAIAPHHNAQRCEVELTAAGQVDSLAVRRADGSTRVLVANITGAAQQVTIEGLGDAEVTMRILDDNAVAALLEQPRAGGRTPVAPSGGELSITLSPYAVAIIEAAST